MNPLTPALFYQAALWLYVAGALAGLAAGRREKAASVSGFGLGATASFSGVVGALLALSPGAPSVSLELNLGMANVPGARLIAQADPLSSFFLLVLSILGFALSLFSIGYVPGSFRGRASGILACCFNMVLLSTFLVFIAANALLFLVAWELMALSAYFLVTFEHHDQATREAGVLYFIMSHVGTGCLILAFILLQSGGDFTFDGLRASAESMSSGRRNWVFGLFLVGFGVKAGIVPLHVWLPEAHPVAPSNASALLSGVLIKTGIYGLTRVLFDFLGAPPNWWGATLLAIGTASALLGVLYALMEHDLKRLLAYHSIENIGIILMGLGASLMFLNTNHPVLAALALTAALYHTLNHAVFKALLFMGAGAVLHSTGTRNMEEMGGLIRRMPKTAICFLVGSVAISALPPLNGFVSEWLTYQALLQGYHTTSSLVRLAFPLSGAMLALTGALAAACFVKAFGITFLAQPRSLAAETAREAGPAMLTGMIVLVLSCGILGLFPTTFLRVMDGVAGQLTGTVVSQNLAVASGLVLGNGVETGGTVWTLGILLTGTALLTVPLILKLLYARHARVRFGPTWDCGLRGLTPAMEYTATGFSKPLRMIFKALFRPRREVQREYDYSPYFAKTLRFESHIEEAFVARIYRPLNRSIQRLSRRMRALQAGSMQAYLIYVFVTLIVLLLLAL